MNINDWSYRGYPLKTCTCTGRNKCYPCAEEQRKNEAKALSESVLRNRIDQSGPCGYPGE